MMATDAALAQTSAPISPDAPTALLDTGMATALAADAAGVNDAPSFVVTSATGSPGRLIQPVIGATGSSSGSDGANAIAVQSDGKILLAGFTTTADGIDATVLRLLPDGTLDPDFGSGGAVLLPVGSGYASIAAMAVQGDGGILLYGSIDGAADADIAVLRLLADGSLDPSFGSAGVVSLDPSGGADYAGGMALQADGHIVLAGSGWNGSNSDFSIQRLTGSGALDGSFGSGGQVLTGFGSGDDSAAAITLQSDGKMVVVGAAFNGSNFDVGALRLNANGSLDTTFNGSGQRLQAVGSGDDFASCVALQSDGKIVIGGSTESASGGFDLLLIRLNANGTLDTSFNGSGRLTIAVGSADDFAYSLLLQPDGKIVLAGQSSNASGALDYSIVRVTSSGALDTTFNGTGKAVVTVGSGDDSAYALARLADGDLLLAGSATGASDADIGLLRLNADGSVDTTFDPTSVSSVGGSVAHTEGGAAVRLDSHVRVQDAELAALAGGAGNYGGASLTLQRQGGADANDEFGATGSLAFDGGEAWLDGLHIGSVTQAGGELTLGFDDGVRQAQVDLALSSLTYRYLGDAPPASVTIGWTFSDGNTGSQGSGGALSAQGTSSIAITATNDAPRLAALIDRSYADDGHTLFSIDLDDAFTDPDGTPLASIALSAVGGSLPEWLSYDPDSHVLSGIAPVGSTASWRFTAVGSDAAGSSASGDFVLQLANQDRSGSAAADTLEGASGNDRLDGLAGDDWLQGLAGDDTLLGGEGLDTLDGGDGNDSLDAGGSDDSLLGGAGDDTLLGGDGKDTLDGGDGADLLDGGASDDSLSGGTGADTLFGLDGQDSLFGGDGDDHLDGGNGNSWLQGGAGSDVLVSGDGNDTLDGGDDADLLDGGASDDALSGGAGADTVFGHDGQDSLFGGDGDDHLDGGNGSNWLQGGAGADTLVASGGQDTLDGGDDADLLDGGAGDDALLGGAGSDTLWAGDGLDTLDGGDGNDHLFGGSGNNLLLGGAGDDELAGEDGQDTLDGGDDADLLAGAGGDDSLLGGAGIDTLLAGDGNDTLDGGSGANLLQGGTGADVLIAADGNDTLDGGDGTDQLRAGAGDDALLGGDGTDTLLAGDGNDTLDGGLGDDSLDGGSGANSLQGGAGADLLSAGDGNDTLDGGTGADTLSGGLGDDLYLVDDSADAITELDGEGSDIVQASASYTLAANLETLLLTGAEALDGTGNAGDNRLSGNAAANRLVGDAGNDTLSGGAGADTLSGGLGDDVYQVGAGDLLVELADQGNDSLLASVNFTLAAGVSVEMLALSGTATQLTGNELANTIRGGALADTLSGLGGNDAIEGLAGSDSLNGGSGDDSLIGGDGNDTLAGGSGSNLLAGGAGDDLYVISSAADLIQEATGQGADRLWSGVNYTLGAGVAVESLTLTGSATQLSGNELANTIWGASLADSLSGQGGDDTVSGGSGNDWIDGGEGSDSLNGGDGSDTLVGGSGSNRLIGGAGDDLFLIGSSTDVVTEYAGQGSDQIVTSVNYTLGASVSVETLTLSGSATQLTGNELANALWGASLADSLNGAGGNDSLTGGDGNDTLVGGAGSNLLIGGVGDDLYVISSATDVIVEADGQGTDRVWAGVNYTLGAGVSVETLSLVGSATQLSGNELANTIWGGALADTLSGLAGNDTLNGAAGNDSLLGGDGNDSLGGGEGNDTLAGGTGTNRLVGGLGDDLYVIGSAADVIVEAAGQGADRIWAGVNYTLAAGVSVETLSLIGSATQLSGNELANTLSGGELADTLSGLAGNDALNGGAGNDSLLGGDGNDSLGGGEGNDTLAGGTGTNWLSGGLGDDLYVIGSASDGIVEAAGQGADRVWAGVNYTLGAGVSVETLSLIGSATQLSGNELANTIWGSAVADTLNGLAGDDTISAAAGNDSILGGDGSDSLSGGEGSDTLVGGSGSNTLVGGVGDDLYVITSASDVISEAASQGADRVWAGINYTLGSGVSVETLSLTGAATQLTGNELANTLWGGALADTLSGLDGSDVISAAAGADVLRGGAGNDTLTGGADNDLFVFDTALNATTNVDRISDFTAGDHLQLSSTVFHSLIAGGSLSATEFYSAAGLTGPSSAAQGDGIYYDRSTGSLYYDADGFGGSAAVKFAVLGGLPTLSAADFTVG